MRRALSAIGLMNWQMKHHKIESTELLAGRGARGGSGERRQSIDIFCLIKLFTNTSIT
ncbi:MAG: hypothetical protein WBA89_11050 [Microcoleus sp.]|uniref:hypothetical protein n=1 Tax=Microcoleus sp. TaxID=44472 RepID=UPI003C79689A